MERNEASFEALFRDGTRHLHQGKPEEAVPLLERANELDPTHVDAAINLGGAYILTKKFQKAVSILEPLSEREQDNAMIWTNLGAAYLGNPVLARESDQLRAIKAFERALVIDPDSPNVAYNIGLIYRDRKEVDHAKSWFQQALMSRPSDAHARQALERLQNPETGDGEIINS